MITSCKLHYQLHQEMPVLIDILRACVGYVSFFCTCYATVEASGACFAVEVSYGCRLYDERSKFYNFNAQAKSAEMCDFDLTTNECLESFLVQNLELPKLFPNPKPYIIP